MILILDGHNFHYEMENLCRLFFPHEHIKVVTESAGSGTGEPILRTCVTQADGTARASAQGEANGRAATASRALSRDDDRDECERLLAVAAFEVLTELRGFTPPWGILTGVRPIKLMHRLISEMGSEEAARDYFADRLLVSPSKIDLAGRIAKTEDRLIARSRPDAFSLYISIPFCPTRCAYCSFVSMWVEKARHLLPGYVELLCRELEETGRAARDLGLTLMTVYIGGGTPTILDAAQLDRLLEAVTRSFDLSGLLEFTVEAGRPDTVTPDKMGVLKRCGVNRVSINPQTMHDAILQNIGRAHTAKQTREAFATARAAGFDHINMDLIAGLPGDTPAGFDESLRELIALGPESLTVHTLALKRASPLLQEGCLHLPTAHETCEMLDTASSLLYGAGYAPYYLYRQSRTVGNLENIGWSRPGYECLYNVYMMDETHTILGAGAGAVTKLKDPYGPYIERIFNFKFPYEYCGRFAETLKRKKGVYAFYGTHPPHEPIA